MRRIGKTVFTIIVSVMILSCAMFSSVSVNAAPAKFDFAASINNGKWQMIQGEDLIGAVPVKDGALNLRMSNDPFEPVEFVYDDPNIVDIELAFDIKIQLDDKCNKAGVPYKWDNETAWCFLMAIRDDYYPEPYWNKSEKGSYTLMYHPKAGGKSFLSNWSSSNRDSKKGPEQTTEVPQMADDKWHSMKIILENKGTDKLRVAIYVDGVECLDYEAPRTSEKGYISFTNQSCAMQLRAFTDIKLQANTTTPAKPSDPTTTPAKSGDTTVVAPVDGTTADTSGEGITTETTDNDAATTSQQTAKGATTAKAKKDGGGFPVWVLIPIGAVIAGGAVVVYFFVIKKK